MIKQTFLFFTFSFLIAFISESSFAQTVLPSSGSIVINGQIVGGENQKIYLINQNMGGLQSPIAVSQTDADGKFKIDTTIAMRDYYFLRLEKGQSLSLVVQFNDSITIYGDAKDLLTYSNIKGSPDSELMSEFLREYRSFKSVEDSLRAAVMADRTQQTAVNTYFSPIAQQFYAYRNNFISTNIQSPAIIAALNAIDQEKEWEMYKQVVTILNQTFGDSPTVRNVAQYVLQKEAQVQQQKMDQEQKTLLFAPGTLVKNIAMPDTAGTIINLSDLKGKVVLIDFWASWCGPCRRENPNVVKAYEKYNKDGFEVFSVSLDKPGTRERWIAAIKKDGLLWPYHVSELNGFNCDAVKDYMVNSIPFTVLIDAEGKVIATNLRGAELEAQLKQIYGH